MLAWIAPLVASADIGVPLEAHPADHVLQFATRGLAEDQDDELIAPETYHHVVGGHGK
jgi:hypothetical protein